MSVEDTLAERGSRYGDFSLHAEAAQNLQDDMRRTKGWDVLSPVQKQALTVIADKIARILSGDPCYADNWHDIQGYAKLVEDRLIDVSKDPAESILEVLGNMSDRVDGAPPCDRCGAEIGGMHKPGCTRLGRNRKSCFVCGAVDHGGLPCPKTAPASITVPPYVYSQ